MSTPAERFDKNQMGELEYELYEEVHQVLEEHGQVWAAEPKFVLCSAIEGLLECYCETQEEMYNLLGMILKQIDSNSKRPRGNIPGD